MELVCVGAKRQSLKADKEVPQSGLVLFLIEKGGSVTCQHLAKW